MSVRDSFDIICRRFIFDRSLHREDWRQTENNKRFVPVATKIDKIIKLSNDPIPQTVTQFTMESTWISKNFFLIQHSTDSFQFAL